MCSRLTGVSTLRVDEPTMVELARRLGAMLGGGEVLLLDGEMGAGKTTFTRALAEGLGVDRPHRVRSPTYAICMRHTGPIELVHLDLFRLGEGLDPGPGTDGGGSSAALDLAPAFAALGLDELGGDPEAMSGPGRVLVVEWSELWSAPPADALELKFRRIPGLDDVRGLSVSARGRRGAALLSRWWPGDTKLD